MCHCLPTLLCRPGFSPIPEQEPTLDNMEVQKARSTSSNYALNLLQIKEMSAGQIQKLRDIFQLRNLQSLCYSTAIAVFVVHVPFMNIVTTDGPTEGLAWVIPLASGLLLICFGEGRKLLLRRGKANFLFWW